MSNSKTFIILGGAGDLAERLLLPGLAEYVASADLSVKLIGAGRTDVDDYSGFVRDAVSDVVDKVSDDDFFSSPQRIDELIENVTFVPTDATDSDELAKLIEGETEPVIYYALSPSVAVDSVEALAKIDVPEGTIFAMEKPFGESSESARELNEALLKVVPESRLFRVDHFLAHQGVLNAQRLRTLNPLFAESWSNEDIEAIEVVFNETLALEGRAEFYDSTGAAEDMLQSHLLQTVARFLAVSEGCSSADILAAMKVGEVRHGRYTAGEIDGKDVPNYVDEEGVDPDNETETWFRAVIEVDTDHWRGVPITLESGKAFGEERKYMRFTFASDGDAASNVLELGFDDNDYRLTVNATHAEEIESSKSIILNSTPVEPKISAYGRVVRAIIEGLDELELSADAAVNAWTVMEEVEKKFADVELEDYEAGTDRIK